MTEEVLLEVKSVSKKFCRDLRKSLKYGLSDLNKEIFGRNNKISDLLDKSSSDINLRDKEFWALKDINFELKRGECLGLVGRNGAGKTTLLKMINGLLKPDTGQITVKGRIGALIALGAGFNPILTGRENIYAGLAAIGVNSKDAKKYIDEIIDFAEIEKFIDTPVRSYSSGMQVRLGFAVATSISPDILILDEVLAVGDAYFRAKCYNRLAKINKNAATLLVSHSSGQLLRLSTKCLLLNSGNMIKIGSPPEILDLYERSMQDTLTKESKIKIFNNTLVKDFEVTLNNKTIGSVIKLNINEKLIIEIKGLIMIDSIFHLSIHNNESYPVAEINPLSPIKMNDETFKNGKLIKEINLGFISPGSYKFSIYLLGPKNEHLAVLRDAFLIKIKGVPSRAVNYLNHKTI